MNKHSHIIFSYAFDGAGEMKKLDGDNTSGELENDGLAWVHLDANNKLTKKWLEKEVSYLDHLIIDALLAEETRSRIIEFDNGLLIILRGVNLNKNSEPEDMVSIRMWVDDVRIITVQRRDMKAVFDLRDNIESGKKIKNSGEFLYNLLYQILSSTEPFLYDLNEKIDKLEEQIAASHNINLRERILQIRSQSAVFKRYLAPQKDVIGKLRSSNYVWIDEWSKRHFQENQDQITRIIEEADEARERSQILCDELSNALGEKLNRSMYKLSLITAIFMPLTFITGLFGSNVGGIPGSNYHKAFFVLSLSLLALAAIQVYFIKKKDWF